ncbi:MAG: response regulator [Chitinophagaceae bacterium]|nr:response regulator [Chitinophagaceae bacterium]
MRALKAIIVDDERLAREEIKRHLTAHPTIDIAGEASNITDAAALIHQFRPDLIFLDVQMGGGSGFDLLESLNIIPHVIFTTAFDRYAVQAFEVDAVDYLVKPIREERFAKAIERIKSRILSEDKPPNPQQTLFVREGNRCHFINTHQISWIESNRNYARLYFNEKKVLIKRSLNQLKKILDPLLFVRVNRTALVNINFITQIKPLPDGRLDVSLQNGQTFTVSARQSSALKNRSILK